MKLCFLLSVLLFLTGIITPSSSEKLKLSHTETSDSVHELASLDADNFDSAGDDTPSGEAEVEEVEKEALFESRPITKFDNTLHKISVSFPQFSSSYVDSIHIPPRS